MLSYALAPYTLVAADEISQLSAVHFTMINILRWQADLVPALCFGGVRIQMSGYGAARPWEAPAWKNTTFTTDLHEPLRCKDEAYTGILGVLRTSKPTNKKSCRGRMSRLWLSQIVRGRKAWRQHVLTVNDVRRLWNKHPNTTMLAVTRRGAALLNALSVKAKFPKNIPIATVAGDIESNRDNYDSSGKLKTVSELKPMQLEIFKGM